MKNSITKIIYILFVFLFLNDNIRAEEKKLLSLKEAYQLTLDNSEVIAKKSEEIKSAEAKYKETISAIYPKITASSSERLKNSTTTRNDFSNFSSTNNSKNTFDTILNIKQPLFTGFREFYVAEANELEIKARKFEQERNKIFLYEDVASIFYQILYYQDDLKIISKTEKTFLQRIKELKQFISLGKSRSSEIQAAEAELDNLNTTKTKVSGLLNASKEMFSFLVNTNEAFELDRKEDVFSLKPLEQLLTIGKEREDLKASAIRTEASGKELIASKREKWPVVYFDGNYYPYQDPDSNRDWDMQVRLDLPIFDGWGIDSRISQAEAKHFASSISTQETRRIIERDIRIAYNNLISSKDEVEKLKTLLNTTKKNYEAQHQDYELGVVTNLQVLAAISNVQDAERRLLDAKTNLKINQVKLQVAAGDIK